MSKKHPIIAVTGSSGAGSMPVKIAFKHIFEKHEINPLIIDGDSFHRYNRYEMRDAVSNSIAEGKTLSHFGPEGNLLDQLEALFKQYGESGSGRRRFYLHTKSRAEAVGQEPGTFTPWEEIPEGTDVLFYQGLHGGVVTDEIDVAQYVDLLIGVVPIVNLEWIQKILRDTAERGYTPEGVANIIMRRMPDYVRYITPQFSRTDINFQRVPTVDTSNPFAARDVPTWDESFVVIRFKDLSKFNVNLPYLLSIIPGAFMSRRNNIVIPGGELEATMEIIFSPIIQQLLEQRQSLLRETA